MTKDTRARKCCPFLFRPWCLSGISSFETVPYHSYSHCIFSTLKNFINQQRNHTRNRLSYFNVIAWHSNRWESKWNNKETITRIFFYFISTSTPLPPPLSLSLFLSAQFLLRVSLSDHLTLVSPFLSHRRAPIDSHWFALLISYPSISPLHSRYNVCVCVFLSSVVAN